jgi:glycosyltransferase involved in cell wall biosynthesis
MATDYMTDCTEHSQADLLPENPIVSVLMITYNHERFIAQAIEGVAKQVTDFPIELVIGEDCSSDSTLQIVLDYQKKHPNLIRVLYPDKNMGGKKNIVRVLAHCRGQFIALCEGDDYWVDPEKLQKQVTFLQANPDFVVTHHGNILIDSEGKVIDDNLPPPDVDEYSKETLLKGGFMQPLNMCYRNVIKSFPDEYFKVVNGDSFLISLLGGYGKAKYLNSIRPSAYRIHQGGAWQGLNENEKNIAAVVTSFWISIYYKKIGEQNVSIFYGERSVERLIDSVSLRNVFLIKLFIKYKLPFLYNLNTYLKKNIRNFFT